MSIMHVLFSFKGRMSRKDYWLKGVLILLPVTTVAVLLMAFGSSEKGVTASFIVGLPILVLSYWPRLALFVKRLHDRDKSGWFLATVLIPIANSVFLIWIVILVWFLKGSAGANTFGEDPLAGGLRVETDKAVLP